MTTNDILHIIQEASFHFKLEFNPELLQMVRINQRSYGVDDMAEFKRDLIEAGRNNHLFFLEHAVPAGERETFIKESKDPVIFFFRDGQEIKVEAVVCEHSRIISLLTDPQVSVNNMTLWVNSDTDEMPVLTVIPYEEIVSENLPDRHTSMSPGQRLFKLLSTEKKEIGYILIYSLIIGLLSLALPLGLQTTIEFISGGVIFSSVYILIGLVILGVLSMGALQIVQISIVEQLQRRVFVKAALEFAYRIPRIRLEAIAKSYAPELVNRFFDIITIQKGLPKLILDLSSGVIQVLFGLLLLSLYHPFFVFFSLFLIGVIFIMFRMTGPQGLYSSINESKYKYKVVQWLEEIARTVKSFKLAGNTDLPIRRTDQVAGNYIAYRKKHFSVLLTQFSFFVFFKVAITGGLLIMGIILVVDRQITLGQFVASEVIIILVLNAVEKIILYADVVYDMLTAVEKVAHVTDLPIEKSGGFDFPKDYANKGYSISLTNLQYKYEGNEEVVLKNINLSIRAGERVCICGTGGSGKSTLMNIIGGLYTDYSGGVSINKFSMRDLDLMHLRDKVANNISADDIFDGTILDNITIGKPSIRVEEILDILDQVGLASYVNTLPDGLNTPVISGGKGLPSSVLQRLILARCLAKKPQLVILNDFFSRLGTADKLELIRCVINPEKSWTLIIVTNDPLVMASCDRVILLDQGQIVADGTYNSLSENGIISKYNE